MRTPRHHARRRAGGFTLIELLVACGLMAVLALLSWRGLDSVLQSRERLVVASDGLRSLTLAFSQMDEDLLRAWPVSQMKLGEPYLRIAVSGERNEQSVHLIREVNRSGMPTRVQRVVYQVRDGQLARGFGEWGSAAAGLGGATSGGVGGAVRALVWQPILAGVRGITVRGWVEGRGWLDASALAAVTQAASALDAAPTPPGSPAPPAAGAPVAPSAADLLAIIGLEVQLDSADGQRFVRVFSVKD